MRFEEPPFVPPLPEGVAEQAASVEVSAERARPGDGPDTAGLEPPVAAAGPSRLPLIIGIILLLGALAFLSVLIIRTR